MKTVKSLGLISSSSAYGLNPVKIDKHGPAYLRTDVEKIVFRDIQNNNYFLRRANLMAHERLSVIEKLDEITEDYEKSLNRFFAMEYKFAAQTKKAASSVRDSSEKLAQGIARVEKAANFERLERYVGLLERASQAMTILADLEQKGVLEKIAVALK